MLGLDPDLEREREEENFSGYVPKNNLYFFMGYLIYTNIVCEMVFLSLNYFFLIYVMIYSHIVHVILTHACHLF